MKKKTSSVAILISFVYFWHLQPIPGQEWTKAYMSCYGGQVLEKLTCQQHEQTGSDAFFSPVKKKCVSRWEVPRTTGYGLQPSCKGKQLGVYRSDERKDVYYSCPSLNVFYCRRGLVYNEAKFLCEPHGAKSMRNSHWLVIFLLLIDWHIQITMTYNIYVCYII